MHQFLVFLEELQFSMWVKNSPSVWAFPTILLVHTPRHVDRGWRRRHARPDDSRFLAF